MPLFLPFRAQHNLENHSVEINSGEDAVLLALRRRDVDTSSEAVLAEILGNVIEHLAAGEPERVLQLAGLGYLDAVPAP